MPLTRQSVSSKPLRRIAASSLVLLGGAAAAQMPPSPIAEAVQNLTPGQSFTSGGITITMRQKDAGAPDIFGMYLARSTDGGFTLRFPARFNDATSVTKTVDGAILTDYMLASSTDTGTRIITNCFKRSDSKIPPGAKAYSARGMQARARRYTSAPFTKGNITGIEYRGVGKDGRDFAGRVFRSDKLLCHLTADFGRTAWPEIPEEVSATFKSFQPAASSKPIHVPDSRSTLP